MEMWPDRLLEKMQSESSWTASMLEKIRSIEKRRPTGIPVLQPDNAVDELIDDIAVILIENVYCIYIRPQEQMKQELDDYAWSMEVT